MACHVVVTHYGCVILMFGYSVDAEILPHTPPLQRLFNREPKTKETIGPHLTFVYTTIENIKYEEVFNNIILSII